MYFLWLKEGMLGITASALWDEDKTQYQSIQEKLKNGTLQILFKVKLPEDQTRLSLDELEKIYPKPKDSLNE